MICNNKVGRGVREFISFSHHEMILVWHLGNEIATYKASVGTEPEVTGLISAGVMTAHAFLSLPFFMCSVVFPCVFSHCYTKTNIWTSRVWFLCVCWLDGLLLTYSENFMAIAALLYLLRILVTCSVLILPSLSGLSFHHFLIKINLLHFCFRALYGHRSSQALLSIF